MYGLSRMLLRISVLISAVLFAAGAAALWPLSGFVIGVLAVAALGRKTYGRLTTLGSARWAEEADLRRARMLNAGKGLIIGRLPKTKRRGLIHAIPGLFQRGVDARTACRGFMRALLPSKGALVSLPKALHTVVFSPSGGGKGVSIIVPFLKTCMDSCIVLDIKGDLARLTAEHRRTQFGHRIVLLDPWEQVTSAPDTFNPLSSISKDNFFAIDLCNALAKALVVTTGEEKEPHFNQASEIFIAALTLMVVLHGQESEGTRSLQTVREILSSPEKLELAIKVMRDSDAWSGLMARSGGQLTHFIDREKASTLTTAGRHMRFLDSVPLLKNVAATSFDPTALLRGKMTIYCIVPPNLVPVQMSLLRMWVTSFFSILVGGGLQERNLVHFVLDEAASLGNLEILNDIIDKGRGYGIRITPLAYQSMGQLKKCWPNGQDQTLLSATTQVFFGVNDQALGPNGGTADYVSSRLGDQTIIVESGGRSISKSTSQSRSMRDSNTSTSHSDSTSSNWQQQARRLHKPEEVIALPSRTAITFTPGVPPVKTELIRYYEEPGLGVQPGPIGRWFAAIATLAICTFMAGLFVFVSFGFCGLSEQIRESIGRQPANQNHHVDFRRPGVPAAYHYP